MRRHQRQRANVNGNGDLSARRSAHPRFPHTAALLTGSPSRSLASGDAGADPVSAGGAPARQSTPPHGHRPAVLTRRQWEVAALVAQGYSNKEIAAKLVLSPGTVANHVEAILRRLRLHNRAQLAAWYVEVLHAPRAGADEAAAEPDGWTPG